MRRVIALAAAVAVPLLSVPANGTAAEQSASPQAAVETLMEADRGYSAAGKDSPLVDALAAMFSDDVIMPLPTGTFAKGKAAAVAGLRTNPANLASTAQWAPIRGGVSGDGQHGFTYGFMTIFEPGKPNRRAKYLAYWVRHPGGWRVAGYKRAGSGEGQVQTAARAPALPARLVSSTPNSQTVEGYRASLIAAEKAFSDEAQRIGVGPAFRNNGSADAMNMGPGPDFIFGNEAIGAGVGGPSPNEPATIHWAADEGAIVASSGDLGVTFGYIRPHKPEANRPAAIPFFTIWRRASPQQPWRYVAE